MQPLLLLHGAVGSSRQLYDLAGRLCSNFKLFTLDFSGHGGRAFADEPFSIELFAQDVLRFMEQQQLSKVSIFGYSMGGYVGMYLARHYPEKIGKVITMATKYSWDEATAAKEIKMLDAEQITKKVPDFAKTLKERHLPNDWTEILQKTRDMMMAMGHNSPLKTDDYKAIQTPVMVLAGDRDKMASIAETVDVYKILPDAQLGILPDTQHLIEHMNTELLAVMIRRFMVQ